MRTFVELLPLLGAELAMYLTCLGEKEAYV